MYIHPTCEEMLNLHCSCKSHGTHIFSEGEYMCTLHTRKEKLTCRPRNFGIEKLSKPFMHGMCIESKVYYYVINLESSRCPANWKQIIRFARFKDYYVVLITNLHNPSECCRIADLLHVKQSFTWFALLNSIIGCIRGLAETVDGK